MLKYKYIFQIKHRPTKQFYQTALGNSVLWFEVSKMLTAVYQHKLRVLFFYNFRHTFVPYLVATSADDKLFGALVAPGRAV